MKKIYAALVLPTIQAIYGPLFITVGIVAQSATPTPPPVPVVPSSESRPYTPFIFTDKKGKSLPLNDGTRELPASPPDPVPAESVIPVTVIDKQARLVPGLKKAAFKVFVDGREAEILSVEQKNDPLNIVIAIDVSPSTHAHLDLVRN